MKISKKRLQEIIQEEYARHESQRYDYPAPGMGPPATPAERMKDEVQTAMMDAAMDLMRAHGLSEKELKVFEYDLEEKLVDAMTDMVIPVTTAHPSINEEEVDEGMLAQAIAEVLSEEGLGDGKKLGGNYNTGSGKGSESPYQTAVGGKDK